MSVVDLQIVVPSFDGCIHSPARGLYELNMGWWLRSSASPDLFLVRRDLALESGMHRRMMMARDMVTSLFVLCCDSFGLRTPDCSTDPPMATEETRISTHLLLFSSMHTLLLNLHNT
jgi:hypothetical protein